MAANAKVNDIPKPKGEEITQGVEDFKFERRMRVLEPLYASAGAPLCRLKPSLNLEGLPQRVACRKETLWSLISQPRARNRYALSLDVLRSFHRAQWNGGSCVGLCQSLVLENLEGPGSLDARNGAATNQA